MKLAQGQIWKLLETREGTLHRVTKKEFCRLIKTAELYSPKEKS